MPVRYVSCATYPCTVDKNVTPRGPDHHVRTLGLTEIHQRMDPFLQGALMDHGSWGASPVPFSLLTGLRIPAHMHTSRSYFLTTQFPRGVLRYIIIMCV
jgi:hypothetical protein